MQNISFLYCFVSRKTTQPSILSRFHSFKSLQWYFVCKIGQIITFTAMDCSRKLAFESNWLLATDNSASIFSWQSIFTLSLWNWVCRNRKVFLFHFWENHEFSWIFIILDLKIFNIFFGNLFRKLLLWQFHFVCGKMSLSKELYHRYDLSVLLQ